VKHFGVADCLVADRIEVFLDFDETLMNKVELCIKVIFHFRELVCDAILGQFGSLKRNFGLTVDVV
jgi:hypothetical protein